MLPAAQLIYCEDINILKSNSMVINKWLFSQGYPIMLVDSSGPFSGMKGKFFPGKSAKYFKGPAPKFDIDHTYSEMVYLGF